MDYVFLRPEHSNITACTVLQPSQNVSEKEVMLRFKAVLSVLVVCKNNTFSDGKETVKFPEEAVR